MRKISVLIVVALVLAGCSDATRQLFQSKRDAAVAKVMELAPAYCKIRPQTSLDDLALAGIALATSERAADIVKAGVDKVCSWVGEPVEQKQAAAD